MEAKSAMKVCKVILIILFTFFVACSLAKTAQEKEGLQAKKRQLSSNEKAETAQVKEWLSYQPAVAEVKGTLRIKSYYGPPNYGENPETDAKEALPILILDSPVNVRGNPDTKAGFDQESVEDVREIQLVLTMPHKELIGKTVVIKGMLFHAFTGHHHTDVLMNVSSIKLDPESESSHPVVSATPASP